MSELKPRITENGIDYILVGDYYIPGLKLPEEHRPIGKYGRMHREYLREVHPARLNTLILTGELLTYLADLNEQAQKGDNKMDFAIFSKTEVEEMFQTMIEHMPENMKNLAVKEFGSVEEWKKHYIEVVSSEEMQKGYAKVVEWYGGKEKFLSVANSPISKEVAESYNKRIEGILQKLIEKRNCDVNSSEVKKIVKEYGLVMKELSQIKNEEEFMLAQAQYYRNEKIKPMIDEKYGKGASKFFSQAIEAVYNIK